MKKTINYIDFNGKVITKEINIRNTGHFEMQLKCKPKVFKNKKAYTRKEKHKSSYF